MNEMRTAGRERDERDAALEYAKEKQDDESDRHHYFQERFGRVVDGFAGRGRIGRRSNDPDALRSPGSICLIFFFTRSITSSAFSPWRMTMMPETTSPVPSRSETRAGCRDPWTPGRCLSRGSRSGLACGENDALDIAYARA